MKQTEHINEHTELGAPQELRIGVVFEDKVISCPITAIDPLAGTGVRDDTAAIQALINFMAGYPCQTGGHYGEK